MQITKRKKQAIKNIVAAILSLLLLFSALRLIPALLCALPDSGADYLTSALNGTLGLDGRRYVFLPTQTDVYKRQEEILMQAVSLSVSGVPTPADVQFSPSAL